LPGAYVSAIRIHGIEISIEPSDQKLIEGCLLNVLEDSKRFLDTYLLRRGLELDVHSEFPDFVLREALVNAIAHRDYTLDEPIRLIVFDDHIEVRSPGQLPDRVALKSLPMSAHVMRNPIIYTMLYRARLASDAGNGIPRIIRLTQQAVGRTPDLRLEGNEFVLSLPRRKPDSSS
jgi:ATP-dependent DNA helicase RecG